MNPKNVISMTELQKLSLKKLREMKLPLFVLDQKSKEGGFVVTSYSKEITELPEQNSAVTKCRALLNSYDFKSKGLFWDRPDLSNKKFSLILRNPKHPEYEWGISRFLERLSSEEILTLFPLPTIQEMLKRAKIRDFIRSPWEHAVNYFYKKTSYS